MDIRALTKNAIRSEVYDMLSSDHNFNVARRKEVKSDKWPKQPRFKVEPKPNSGKTDKGKD